MLHINFQRLWVCSNHCPDEKGTERGIFETPYLKRDFVATIAPMKRGLKEPPHIATSKYVQFGSNHCPDEKGTESFR